METTRNNPLHDMEKIRYHIGKWLVGLANRIDPTPSRYAVVDNQDVMSRRFLESFLEGNPDVTVAYVLSDEGWIDITPENSSEMIAKIERSLEIERQLQENGRQ